MGQVDPKRKEAELEAKPEPAPLARRRNTKHREGTPLSRLEGGK